MINLRVRAGLLLAIALGFLGVNYSFSQERGKTKDDALDSLIEQLAKPEDAASTQRAKPSERGDSKAATEVDGSRSRGQARTEKPKTPAKPSEKATAGTSGKAAAKKQRKDTVAPKDQELDSLLEKLGESKDTPAAEDRPSGPGGADEPKPAPRPDKPRPPQLGGKDKDIDERLEEYTGRRKKRSAADEKRSGPVGEIIKEMRDVEQRLAKPDTGGDTQNRQKQIVKRIETLIELVRQSGGSGMGFRMRRVRQPGQQGQQPGDETGALARGAPPTKPASPTRQHANVGSKDVWGHLPPELQQVMETSFKETSLAAKEELIDRYFLSVSKGKLVREE
jgi:hypothetical protein